MLPELDLNFDEAECINCYALVTYIPDPLGRFFDDLRKTLVPGSDPRAHVTVMPPRPIFQPREAAFQQIYDLAGKLPAFELEATEVAVFEETNVIYVEIDLAGRTILESIHAELNRGALEFEEPFEYHPHITIAQELKAPEVPAAAEYVREAWRKFERRTFPVERLTFVQNTVNNRWLDLGCALLLK